MIAFGAVLLSVLLALSSLPALAISPILGPPNDVLCNSDYVFLGRVVSANMEGNQPRLEIVVTRIFGVRENVARNTELGMRVGQRISARTSFERSSSGKVEFGVYGLGLKLPVPAGAAAVTNGMLKAGYVGREFLMSGGIGYVIVWSPESVGWATDVLAQRAGRSCPSPL